MTAEVAILNKTAVALAADSAVTISVGNNQQKIFDTEDKLFELTRSNAIAAMINSNMNFMEAPLPVLIKKYRELAPEFQRVREAADHFLNHLDEFVQASPDRIERDAIQQTATQILAQISSQAREMWSSRVMDPETGKVREDLADNVDALVERLNEITVECHEAQISFAENFFASLPAPNLIGGDNVSLNADQMALLSALVDEHLTAVTADQKERSVNLIVTALRNGRTGGSSTGLVIAGFGTADLFPTLISFELYGSFGGRLKYVETNIVDIDRDGVRARVLPFAQSEMVERFLYGLDGEIDTAITEFCRGTVSSIGQQIVNSLDMTEDDRTALMGEIGLAEQAFIAGLGAEGFEAIRARSRQEIEDMVEFMPKPELARMAEALVNLTSIKRRVSRGFETVGGPIDVAVISKSDGLVWVARKHYFPQELNARYFDRMRLAT